MNFRHLWNELVVKGNALGLNEVHGSGQPETPTSASKGHTGHQATYSVYPHGAPAAENRFSEYDPGSAFMALSSSRYSVLERLQSLAVLHQPSHKVQVLDSATLHFSSLA